MMNLPLNIYRISGWIVIVIVLFLAYSAIKNKNLWQGRYKFIGAYICWFALSNLIGGITSVLNINNLFFYYLPLSFILKALYLKGEHNSKAVHYITYFSIAFYVLAQTYKAFDGEGYKQFNTLGAYSGYPFFIIYCIWNLTILFREKNTSKKLRRNPDFWFTATMLTFSFVSLVSTILDDTSYANSSDTVLYYLFSAENFIDCFIYYGYFRGVKLVR